MAPTQLPGIEHGQYYLIFYRHETEEGEVLEMINEETVPDHGGRWSCKPMFELS